MKRNKRQILLGIALGVFVSFCLFVFALGYLIYSLLPSFDNLQIQNQLHVVSGKVMSPECQKQLMSLAENASVWDLFQIQKWTDSLSPNCVLEMNPEPENTESQDFPAPPPEAHDSEVI